MRPTLLPFVLCLFLPAAAAQSGSTATEATSLARVVSIGASVSDGFANGVPLARFIEKAITVPHRRVERCTSSMFFLMPLREGKRQIDRAERVEASLVLGPDYLFWYGYGRPGQIQGWARGAIDLGGKEGLDREVAIRSWLLDQGLAQLDRLQCRIVVGDLPDMRGADPKMLAPAQIPDENALAALNERVRAWAKARPNVLLLPMARWVQDMKNGQMALARRGGEGDPVKLEADQVLGQDRLHPSKLGAVVFCEVLLRAVRDWLGPPDAEAISFDAWSVLEDLGLVSQLGAAGGKKG